jgi:hypothetical protein
LVLEECNIVTYVWTIWTQRTKTADGLKHVPLLSSVSECGVAIPLWEYLDGNKTCWMTVDNPSQCIVQLCRVTVGAFGCAAVSNAVYC